MPLINAHHSLNQCITHLFLYSENIFVLAVFLKQSAIMLKQNNLYSALQITRKITKNLQDDFGRRRTKDKKPLCNANEVARIRSAFSLIPSFLGKENKRYVL